MDKKLKSHFINMYLIALSDDEFSATELDTILKIGQEKGLSSEEFEQIISNPVGIHFQSPESFMEKIHLLYDFARVIWADGVVLKEERESFLRFCKKFHFAKGESEELFEWLIGLAKQNIDTEQLDIEIQKLITK